MGTEAVLIMGDDMYCWEAARAKMPGLRAALHIYDLTANKKGNDLYTIDQ